MKIEINIRDSHVLIILLFITAASAMGLVVAYGGTAPATMGHSWGEMECAGCIINSNLADGSVTTAKIASNSVTGAKLGCDGILCKNPSGNVGIGTNNPETKLDVNGQINATGDICTESNGGICLIGMAAEIDNLGPGLGSGTPASGGVCGGYTLLPEGVAIYNNRLAVKYGNWPCPPGDCGFDMCFYNRYYFGNDEWSDCVLYYCGYCNCETFPPGG